jgi:hypothetical protein
MRFLMLLFFACFMGKVNGAAQCPAQLRQALFNEDGKNASIRYYNAGTQAAKEVQFVLILQNPGSSLQTLVGSFSAKGIVRPGQARTVVFPYTPGAPLNGPMELEVKRILFVDGTAWAAPRDNDCKIGVRKTRGSDAAQ